MGATGWIQWDSMPEHSGSESGYQAYLKWKELSDALTKMGSALAISQSYQAKSSVEPYQGSAAASTDDSDDEETVVSTLEDFLRSYGSRSESMGLSELQAAIEEAASWKASATGDQSIWLDEIIASLQKELEPIPESVLGLEDFLSSNNNLSVSAQIKEIQDRIDTALSFDTSNATDEQKQVLSEIVSSSEEAIKNLAGKKIGRASCRERV